MGLYNADNTSIGVNEGLKTTYFWGLFSLCGYFRNATFNGGGECQSSIASPPTPFEVISNDAPQRYGALVNFYFSSFDGINDYNSSNHFTSFAHAAFVLTLIAIISTGLTLIL